MNLPAITKLTKQWLEIEEAFYHDNQPPNPDNSRIVLIVLACAVARVLRDSKGELLPFFDDLLKQSIIYMVKNDNTDSKDNSTVIQLPRRNRSMARPRRTPRA